MAFLYALVHCLRTTNIEKRGNYKIVSAPSYGWLLSKTLKGINPLRSHAELLPIQKQPVCSKIVAASVQYCILTSLVCRTLFYHRREPQQKWSTFFSLKNTIYSV